MTSAEKFDRLADGLLRARVRRPRAVRGRGARSSSSSSGPRLEPGATRARPRLRRRDHGRRRSSALRARVLGRRRERADGRGGAAAPPRPRRSSSRAGGLRAAGAGRRDALPARVLLPEDRVAFFRQRRRLHAAEVRLRLPASPRIPASRARRDLRAAGSRGSSCARSSCRSAARCRALALPLLEAARAHRAARRCSLSQAYAGRVFCSASV